MKYKQWAGYCSLYKFLAGILMFFSIVSAQSDGMLITEVSVNPADGAYPWVEMMNSSSENRTLAGTQLAGSVTYTFDKKGTMLEPGSFVVIIFDGKKGIETRKGILYYHTQKVLNSEEFAKKGEIALVTPDGLLSYISWGDPGESIYKSNAVANGKWQSKETNLSVEPKRVGPGNSFKKGGSWSRARNPKGEYINEWEVRSPEETTLGASSALSGPGLYVPSDGIQITSIPDEKVIKLIWYRTPEYAQYRLQICLDRTCSVIMKDVTTSNDYYAFSEMKENSNFFWRVAGLTQNGTQSSWSETRKVIYGYPERTGSSGSNSILAITEERVLGVPALAARKDSRLLCLDTWHTSATDGCDLNNATHPWDNSHVAAAHYCECGSWRCWAVGAAMMNRYYGGTATIDEVKFNIKGGGAPEDDFPHGMAGGASYDECRNAHAWALQTTVANINVSNTKPTEAVIRDRINNNRPIYWIDGGHVMVLDGYRVNGGSFEIRMLNTDNNGSIQWRTLSTQVFAEYHCPASAGTTGCSTNPLISTDSDGDGIMDFDETNRFLTNPNSADSDNDGIIDKIEVYSYSQAQDIDHASLDPDADGYRPERDFDSDGGRKPDGYEDVNANGVHDAGESNTMQASDDGAIPNDLTISNQTISSSVTYLARNSITIGPSVVINNPANVTFSAGRSVILNSGITQNSGRVKTAVDPNLR